MQEFKGIMKLIGLGAGSVVVLASIVFLIREALKPGDRREQIIVCILLFVLGVILIFECK